MVVLEDLDLRKETQHDKDIKETKLKIQQKYPYLSGSEVGAFAFAISEERMGAEIGSVNEYYNMMEDGEQIIKEFSDGEITQADISHYHEFSTELYDREVEMNISIGLLEKLEHKNPLAAEKVKFLRIKRAKLIQTRQIIDRATEGKREVSVKPLTEREKKKALAYTMALTYTKKDKKIPREAAVRLGIETPQDVKEISIMKDRMPKSKEIVTKDNLQDRLNRLRGLADSKSKNIGKHNFKKRDISQAFNSKEAEALLRSKAEYEMSM